MRKRTRLWSLAAAAAGLLLAGQVSATPLGLVLDPSPDLFFGFGSLSYDSGTQSLTFDAQPQDYFLAATACDPACSITAALTDLSLTASIDNSGSLSSGSISIGGSVGPLGYGAPLLTGTLTAFGFDSGTPSLPFEFLFTVTGGSAAGDFGGNGATAGIILSHNSSFTGSFGSDFSSSFTSVGDVGSVPEPAAGALLALALGLTGASTRRRRAARP